MGERDPLTPSPAVRRGMTRKAKKAPFITPLKRNRREGRRIGQARKCKRPAASRRKRVTEAKFMRAFFEARILRSKTSFPQKGRPH